MSDLEGFPESFVREIGVRRHIFEKFVYKMFLMGFKK